MSYAIVGYLCFGNGVFIGLLIGYWLARKNADGVASHVEASDGTRNNTEK